jgi:hypothetical protein
MKVPKIKLKEIKVTAKYLLNELLAISIAGFSREKNKISNNMPLLKPRKIFCTLEETFLPTKTGKTPKIVATPAKKLPDMAKKFKFIATTP